VAGLGGAGAGRRMKAGVGAYKRVSGLSKNRLHPFKEKRIIDIPCA